MTKPSVFKTDFGAVSHVTDPETLFRDIRGRSADIKHLWSHQADILRSYNQQYLKTKDVAIELPTGAGKTLVGLLIAEFRRQAFNERVAYLCPTRQLARQVVTQATKYGIRAYVFVGKQANYPPAEYSEFQSSKAIAVTTYSAIFNSNPRISDAQVLVLDDAHASENYIANMWTIEINRNDYANFYNEIVDLLRNGLPPAFYSDIKRNDRYTDIIELVPGKHVRERLPGLRDLLDSNLDGTPSWFAWNLIKEHIHACSIFISGRSILIRPFIPPTLTHSAFTCANQRVYMSATLGAGGEIERITGVKSIARIPIPPGWDKRGSGRRLFLIPQVAMQDDEAKEVVGNAIKDFDRSLILVPNQQEITLFRDMVSQMGTTILESSDIEDSLKPFSAQKDVSLILSRYDGLDLPDDMCRLLIFGGLPSGTNLQEKFLWSRIAASSLLRDRVLTRFTQGVGRCTRSDNDFAVVLLWGRSLVDFILKQENRSILNPELQAEIQFGIENSREKKAEDFLALWQTFIKQDKDWEDADAAIVNLRERSSRAIDHISERLSSTVSNEVSYLYSLWKGDLESALEQAREVADALSGDETKGYRGWWYYLAADTAMALYESKKDGNFLGVAKDYLTRAGKCCPAISWFARLSRIINPSSDTVLPNEGTATAIENIRNILTEWGGVGGRFEKEVKQAKNDLKATEYKQFHRGLKALGLMLGFHAEIPEGEGDPDCVWTIGSAMHIAHEAKSDHTPKDPIGINDVRQAQSHEEWVRKNRSCDKTVIVLPLIISPRECVSDKAKVYSKSLCHATPERMLSVCERITDVLRRVRSSMADISDEKMLERLHHEITAAKLTPHDIFKEISSQSVTKMPVC